MIQKGQGRDLDTFTAMGQIPRSTERILVVNELLTYVTVYRDRVSAENLRKVLIGFCTTSEINIAKKLLVGTFTSDLVDCSYKAERRKSATRGVNEAEAEDIVGIFEYLDERSHLSKITFAAVNLERLPKYGPEEINICSVVDKQSELGTSVACLAARVDEMAMDHSSSKLAELKAAVTDTVLQGFDCFRHRLHIFLTFVLNCLMG